MLIACHGFARVRIGGGVDDTSVPGGRTMLAVVFGAGEMRAGGWGPTAISGWGEGGREPSAASAIAPSIGHPARVRCLPAPAVPPVDTLCGAPANPYGFTFRDTGRRGYAPATGACEVFACIRNFPNGLGHLVLCGDGWVSLSGGRPGTCSSHKGWSRDVFQSV
ncbi:hypothetical protein GCM10017673_43880 [Streptosporangium violaceochromogenes]|nr:hypothetical protein GCM10017673_43880 [Streptosporangium violaceochromogenes]